MLQPEKLRLSPDKYREKLEGINTGYQNAKDTHCLLYTSCGADSISSKIYEKELEEADSFTNRYHSLLQNFEYQMCIRDSLPAC